jgi:hypothetical protein
MCTTSRRIPESASGNEGGEKGDLILLGAEVEGARSAIARTVPCRACVRQSVSQ